jgi:hypothetical protein
MPEGVPCGLAHEASRPLWLLFLFIACLLSSVLNSGSCSNLKLFKIENIQIRNCLKLEMFKFKIVQIQKCSNSKLLKNEKFQI